MGLELAHGGCAATVCCGYEGDDLGVEE